MKTPLAWRGWALLTVLAPALATAQSSTPKPTPASSAVAPAEPKAIEETYQYIATSFSFPTRIAAQGLRNTLDMVAQRNPKIDMNLAKYVDESTLDELEKEGFFKRITGK